MSTQVEISDAKKQLKRAKNALMENPTDPEQWLISAKCHRALNLNDYAMIDLERMEMLVKIRKDENSSRDLLRCYMEYVENSMVLNRFDLAWLYVSEIRELPGRPSTMSDYAAAMNLMIRFQEKTIKWTTKYGKCVDEVENPNGIGRIPEGYNPDFKRHVDLDSLNEDLRRISKNLTLAARGGNHFGLYAKKDIKKGEIILREKTRICVTSNSDRCEHCTKPLNGWEKGWTMKCKRCGICFCSADCMKEALSSYHLLLCSKVKTESYQEILRSCRKSESATGLNSLLLLRVYSIAIKENISPLEIEEIKTLCPSESFLSGFLYNYNLDQFYFKLLKLLNISPYQPAGRFDFHTYKHVISMFISNIFGKKIAFDSNPAFGRPLSSEVFRLTSFFNHSCNPNAEDEIDGNNTRVTAIRNIKKGEEVFISYTALGRAKLDRGKTLCVTYGFDCKCTECLADKSPSFLESVGGPVAFRSSF